MINIEKITPMEFNYFEAPNKLISFESDQHTMIIAELSNIQVERDVCVDAKAFEMIKKLATNRNLMIENNSLVIKSKEGKFKTQLIDRVKPTLKLETFHYENKYNTVNLKRALKFVSKNNTRIFLCGVLFNENGGVAGTDSFKVYQYENIENLKYSVPAKFINLLNEDKCLLKFSDNKVMYDGDYKIISNLYSGNVPNIQKLVEIAKQDCVHEITIKKQEEMNFFQSSSILLNLTENNLELIYKDNENEFKVNASCLNNVNIKYKFAYEHLMIAFDLFNNELNINFSQNNNKPVIFKNNNENIVIMPMVLQREQ